MPEAVGKMSDYLEQAILNHVFRGEDYTPPTQLYVALYTSNPTDEDTGTEVNADDYDRLLVEFTEPEKAEDGAHQIENTEDIQWPVTSEDWGKITHVGVRDAETSGNLLYYGPLKYERNIYEGDQFLFYAGNLNLKLD